MQPTDHNKHLTPNTILETKIPLTDKQRDRFFREWEKGYEGIGGGSGHNLVVGKNIFFKVDELSTSKSSQPVASGGSGGNLDIKWDSKPNWVKKKRFLGLEVGIGQMQPKRNPVGRSVSVWISFHHYSICLSS